MDREFCVAAQPTIPATNRTSHEMLTCVGLLSWNDITVASTTLRSHKPDTRRYVLGHEDLEWYELDHSLKDGTIGAPRDILQ